MWAGPGTLDLVTEIPDIVTPTGVFDLARRSRTTQVRYGDDWEERGDRNYLAIENLDSDRDGFSNRVEIEALSFPGDPSSTPLTVITTTTQPGTPPDGQALYAASCAACHGPGGGNRLNTPLNEPQFVNVVANRQGASMPAFGGALSSADIGAIYAYVTGAPPTTTTAAPETPPQPSIPPPCSTRAARAATGRMVGICCRAR